MARRKRLERIFANLSDDAKAVGAAWFGMMHPGTTEGVFLAMRENRPSDRTAAALKELIASDIVLEKKYPDGSLRYLPCIHCGPLLSWALARIDDPSLKFSLVEPISGSKQEEPSNG